MSDGKVRLDLYLTNMGFCVSRERAQELIRSGGVLVDGKQQRKPSAAVLPEQKVALVGEDIPFVSRGGLKLQKALQVFPIAAKGLTALDVGASTGGFTDCLLQHGAKKVYAVDVGHGQLHESLLSDGRVCSMEGTNARFITAETLGEAVDLVVCDASFISLALLLPAMKACMKPEACAVVLVKPQFEAGREALGKNGVVRDKTVHIRVLEKVIDDAKAAGLRAVGLDHSPITGPKGNIEFLLYLDAQREGTVTRSDIERAVAAAHANL